MVVPVLIGGTMEASVAVLLFCIGTPLVTAVCLSALFLYFIRKTVQEINKSNLDFFEEQSKRIADIVENQSRLMGSLLEAVADRLMSKGIDEYRGVPTNSVIPAIEEELDPEEEMRRAGLDPSSEDDLAAWNDGVDLKTYLGGR